MGAILNGKRREKGHLDRHFDKDLKYHEVIAREYDGVVVAPRQCTNDALYKKFAPLMRGQRMLDLGCGTGHMSLRFGDRFSEVLAVDHSAAMMDVARAKVAARKLPVKFQCVSVFDYIDTAPADYFDAVCCTGFLHHLKAEDIGPTLLKVARLMRPKAVLLTSEPIHVPAGSVPQRVSAWNAVSVAATLSYSQHVEQPDEAPIEQQTLLSAFETAGLALVKTHRNWEIFPHHLPPRFSDRAAIRLLNALYGKAGNVFTAAALKP